MSLERFHLWFVFVILLSPRININYFTRFYYLDWIIIKARLFWTDNNCFYLHSRTPNCTQICFSVLQWTCNGFIWMSLTTRTRIPDKPILKITCDHHDIINIYSQNWIFKGAFRRRLSVCKHSWILALAPFQERNRFEDYRFCYFVWKQYTLELLHIVNVYFGIWIFKGRGRYSVWLIN